MGSVEFFKSKPFEKLFLHRNGEVSGICSLHPLPLWCTPSFPASPAPSHPPTNLREQGVQGRGCHTPRLLQRGSVSLKRCTQLLGVKGQRERDRGGAGGQGSCGGPWWGGILESLSPGETCRPGRPPLTPQISCRSCGNSPEFLPRASTELCFSPCWFWGDGTHSSLTLHTARYLERRQLCVAKIKNVEAG